MSISPLALLFPRPPMSLATISPSSPAKHRLSNPTSLPQTPQRNPTPSHSFLSPPAAHRNSTDSWNSSNYDLDVPEVEWKDEEVRLLSRTLDALPAHLLTPFNGLVPPSNLLDKLARGIAAAKGPNDWPHTVRATRVRLLELARVKAQEETLSLLPSSPSALSPGHVLHRLAQRKGEKRARTSDPTEVLQPRTNTPNARRRALYRKSSMDFINLVTPDRHESIVRLSNRFQRHDQILHHPYHRPAHLRRRSDHTSSLTQSTPSSSTLGSNDKVNLRKSTASDTSASTSSFGSPMSLCAPLRPSSLRRASTFTLGNADNMLAKPVQVLADADLLSKSKSEDAREALKAKPVKARSPAGKKLEKPVKSLTSSKTLSANKMPSCGGVDVFSPPETPPPEMCALTDKNHTTSTNGSVTTNTPLRGHARKARKGHQPHISLTSDEEYNERSKKKVRTRAPSSSLLASPSALGLVADSTLVPVSTPGEQLLMSPQITTSAALRAKSSNRSRRGSGTSHSKSSRSDTLGMVKENKLSVRSAETALTVCSPAAGGPAQSLKSSTKVPKVPGTPKDVSQGEQKRPARRNLARNPSMFGPELPNPQKMPRSPAYIPDSSPSRCDASPVPAVLSPSPSTVSCPVSLSPAALSSSSSSPPVSRPHTLRRAARRIEFGSIQPSRMSPIQDAPTREAGVAALGSAFQLA